MNPISEIRSYLRYRKALAKLHTDFCQFEGAMTSPRFELQWKDRIATLGDDTHKTAFDAHYIYHTGWAARVLSNTHPELHTDISSSLYFISMISAFFPVKFYDYRPAQLNLDNLESGSVDLTRLPFEKESIESLSCMHVVEHIGLGRYGDPLDPDGDLKAISELKRVLAPGGKLLFVVPVGGTARIQFNAHRIYTYEQVREYFSEFELKEFALIPDNAVHEGIVRHANPLKCRNQKYACGCFHFQH